MALKSSPLSNGKIARPYDLASSQPSMKSKSIHARLRRLNVFCPPGDQYAGGEKPFGTAGIWMVWSASIGFQARRHSSSSHVWMLQLAGAQSASLVHVCVLPTH